MLYWIVGYFLILFLTSTTSLKCENGGITILTRTKAAPYNFDYKCLCPYNYYGSICSYYRGILCYIGAQSVQRFNEQSGEANLQFQMYCYLQKIKKFNSTVTFSEQTNDFYRLPLNQSQLSQQLTQHNYYIESEYQIVWSNQTSLFDNLGQLIKNQSQARSDSQILNSYPHYQFNYTSNFFGVPLFHNNITFKISAVRFQAKSFALETPTIEFEKQVVKDKIIGNFRLNINKQLLQFQVGKIELAIEEYYGDEYKAYHKVSMNNGKWRIFDKNFDRGKIIQGDTSHMPGSVRVLLMFIFGFILIFAAKKLMKLYKSWKNRTVLQQLELQDQKD